jgi:predicted amidohydrolase YtcJ
MTRRALELLVVAVWLAGGGHAEAKRPAPADTIFFGGPILTINPVGEAGALAVRDGIIVAVGDLDAVLPFHGPSTNVIDLAGKTLMPGFVEPHLHINLTASNLSEVQCGSEEPGGLAVQDVKKALADALPSVQLGGWLLGNGFDPSRTTPLFGTLTLDDLNSISTTVPIFVLNASGHIAYVNSKAYEVAGVTDSTPDPPGGTYVKDASGHLNGQLHEPPAYAEFTRHFPAPSFDALVASWAETLAGFSRKGVTTVGDLNTGLSLGTNAEIEILRRLAPAAPVRVRSYLAFLTLPPDLSTPVAPFEGDDKLRFIGVKFTADGSTQGFTAALTQPYLCRDVPASQCAPGSTGRLDFSDTAQLRGFAQHFFDAGWQISSHANGDLAIDQVLDVYGSVLASTIAQGRDPAARRLRIEHFTVTQEAQIDRVKQLGVTVSMTDGHIFFWGQPFELNILGSARAQRIDAAASLKARGVRYSYHSDSTVTSVAPLRYMQIAVTRTPQLAPPLILGPDQRITIDDALRATTLDAAYQLFIDDKVGSLEVGKYADLVVLDRNPRTTDPFELTRINVVDVYLGGQRTYAAGEHLDANRSAAVEALGRPHDF